MTKTLYHNQSGSFLIEEITWQEDDVTIEDSKKFVMLHLIGRLTQEEHKEGFETALELAKANGYSLAVFNYLRLEYDPPQSRAWFVSHYVPRYAKELGRHMWVAVVEPQNAFQRITTSLISASIQKIYKTLHISFFSELERAKEWLSKQKTD